MAQDDGSAQRYWDGEVEKARAAAGDRLWYRYMQAIYDGFVAGLGGPLRGPSLKTDLYEEAVAEHAPLPGLPGPRFGIDTAPAVVAAARANLRRRGDPGTLVAADVRALPFADGAFGLVLSGSTLDHFEDRRDLLAGLAELARVLAPGGTLALTLDNPHNPVLGLRRSLGWLSRRRLHPYFVGETLTRREGIEALEGLGLAVRRTRAIAHAPRDPAMRLARRSGAARRAGRGRRPDPRASALRALGPGAFALAHGLLPCVRGGEARALTGHPPGHHESRP